MATPRRKSNAPATPPLPTIQDTETTQAPAEPISITLRDAKKPTKGVFNSGIWSNTLDTEIAGYRFDQILDNQGRFIAALDNSNLYGTPLRGVLLGCGANQTPIPIFLDHSTSGVSSMQHPFGDVDRRATVHPTLFQTLLESHFLTATGHPLSHYQAQQGDMQTISATSSPIVGLCAHPVVQSAISKSKENTR